MVISFPSPAKRVTCILMVVISFSSPDKQVNKRQKDSILIVVISCFSSNKHVVCILMVVISCCFSNKQVKFVFWFRLSASLSLISRSCLYTDGGCQLLFPRQTGQVCLSICLWLGPPWFNYWFSFTLAYSRISHEYSPLFIIVIHLIFMFSLWCIDWVGSLYANRISMYFYIKNSIGTQGEVS